MAHHVLIVSPIPSHPQDQGNSARIFSLGRLLQSAGVIVHFLYYQMEGLRPQQRREMEACWDHLHCVPCSLRDNLPTGENGCYGLDDWFEPAVTVSARNLHRRYRFAAVISNYVWFSGVLDAFGPEVLRVLDTHDVFGGRDERFRAVGLAPEWFFTTREEEARGLARADIVLAIQDEEAAELRLRGHGDVRSLGHLLPCREPALRPIVARPTIGYLASGNPLNLSSFNRLRARLLQRPEAAARLRFVVAGSICDHLPTEAPPFEMMGRVADTADFYDRVDAVVNPMTAGTGLKIKSVEAVFEGLPLLATTEAMTGLPVLHPAHGFASPEALADWLLESRLDRTALEELSAASRDCAARYGAGVLEAVGGLLGEIVRQTRSSAPGPGSCS
jgi:hypothetical protein